MCAWIVVFLTARFQHSGIASTWASLVAFGDLAVGAQAVLRARRKFSWISIGKAFRL